MKIDIHTHTRKCKSGDAPTREISSQDFCDTVKSTEVGIIAITNHNVFDLTQFQEVLKSSESEFQVWPGVELDVEENKQRGHLLVIVSPEKAGQFSGIINEITKDSSPDTFTITIDKVVEKFDALSPLYVAHYRQKAPSLSDEAIDKLIEKSSNPSRVIKEVTNSISAGIYISHGYASIYGSDVRDWSTYVKDSEKLPDLRLPVESFDHFCLLLEKDQTTINTILNKKTAEILKLKPFEDDSELIINAYNDINVFFGPKGTGKSCILDAIAKHYCDKGVDATVYESGSDKLDEIFDTGGKNLSVNLNTYKINYCKDEIESIRKATEVGVTNLSKYALYLKVKSTNKNAKKIKISEIDTEQEFPPKREFSEFNNGLDEVQKFLKFLNEDPSIKNTLDETELLSLKESISELAARLLNKKHDSYSHWKERCLLNSAIEKFRTEIERKTGTHSKPTTTGFKRYALNRIKIEAATSEIIKSLDSEIETIEQKIGSLGSNKGDLFLKTEFIFQKGSITDGTLNKMRSVNKGTQKEFVKGVRQIAKHVYENDLFNCISNLNDIEGVENIETVYELLLFRRYFSIEDKKYSPSSGEASMVLLQKELETDKDVYILDEPERSLGNEYISDVIVPLIRERARAGKKIFISTHDANIAVRTLPYSSIYRRHDSDGYLTYVGNPYSNNLVNSKDENDVLDWKVISMKTLEGGKEAFGERGKIYGNS